jgi:hypothetical protein
MNRRDMAANATLTSSFLNNAMMRVNRELRCPANESWVNITIQASGYTGVTVPTDYLELIGLFWTSSTDWNVRIRNARLEKVLNYAQFQTDKPLLFARQGGQWILGPSPSPGDIIALGYYAEVPPLVNPTDTNIISIIAWDLYTYGALAYACEYYNDKRKDMFEARYQQILSDLNEQGEDDELAEMQIQPTHSYPDDDTDNYEIWVP